jgi:hypothetical protein
VIKLGSAGRAFKGGAALKGANKKAPDRSGAFPYGFGSDAYEA